MYLFCDTLWNIYIWEYSVRAKCFKFLQLLLTNDMRRREGGGFWRIWWICHYCDCARCQFNQTRNFSTSVSKSFLIIQSLRYSFRPLKHSICVFHNSLHKLLLTHRFSNTYHRMILIQNINSHLSIIFHFIGWFVFNIMTKLNKIFLHF